MPHVRILFNGLLPVAIVDLQQQRALIWRLDTGRMGPLSPSVRDLRRLKETAYVLWRTVPYHRAFNGRNSLMLDLGRNKYMYVGGDVFTFTSLEEVVSYSSPLGPNVVPYPVAHTRSTSLLMLEKVAVPKTKDAYGKYYDDHRVGRPMTGINVVVNGTDLSSR